MQKYYLKKYAKKAVMVAFFIFALYSMFSSLNR